MRISARFKTFVYVVVLFDSSKHENVGDKVLYSFVSHSTHPRIDRIFDHVADTAMVLQLNDDGSLFDQVPVDPM